MICMYKLEVCIGAGVWGGAGGGVWGVSLILHFFSFTNRQDWAVKCETYGARKGHVHFGKYGQLSLLVNIVGQECLRQWSPTPVLEIYLPEHFSSNRNHAHLIIQSIP